MTVGRLREWRGVKPVAAPSGVAITTRLRTTAADEVVLAAVAAHLGSLRRADLGAVARAEPLGPALDGDATRQVRRDRLNTRKAALTAQSSARWANAITRDNDEQYRLARNSQQRHIIGLRAAISTIEKRLAQPTADTLTTAERAVRRKARLAKGYPTKAERFAKQQRVQHLRAELARAESDRDANAVHITEGTKRLAKTRHHLEAAGLTLSQWQENWECARYRIHANGSGDEPFGNLTITVTPYGEVSLRMPKPLEHLANAKHGRYVLSGQTLFCYRTDEWIARITGGESMSYSITRKPGRAGRYLTASWATTPGAAETSADRRDGAAVRADCPVVGVDLNAGHLALRRLDKHGNPIGTPARIDLDLSGDSGRRDAQVRHAITRLIHYAQRDGIDTIAVEDLDFSDARSIGRETMGRGRRAKRLRATVAGIPTAVFRNHLAAQASAAGIRLFAVNPAYSSAWGAQHWRKPYKNVTRHQAAATVIGRRAQGYRARRREGVTRTRPEDRVGRATNQAAPTAHRRSPAAATSQGCEEPNLARPTGNECDYPAGQPLPRQWLTTAN